MGIYKISSTFWNNGSCDTNYRVFFMTRLFARLSMRVDILLTCWKCLHDLMIFNKKGVLTHKTSSTSPLFIVPVPIPSHENELLCIYVLG